jgi:organic hydroperoxide reductase OsmC/OhrA
MLFFLSVAAKSRFVVDEYIDNAVGIMAADENGRIMMTRVVLRPSVRFAAQQQPTADQLKDMHHRSHEQCFIANSVKTEVVVDLPAVDG